MKTQFLAILSIPCAIAFAHAQTAIGTATRSNMNAERLSSIQQQEKLAKQKVEYAMTIMAERDEETRALLLSRPPLNSVLIPNSLSAATDNARLSVSSQMSLGMATNAALIFGRMNPERVVEINKQISLSQTLEPLQPYECESAVKKLLAVRRSALTPPSSPTKKSAPAIRTTTTKSTIVMSMETARLLESIVKREKELYEQAGKTPWTVTISKRETILNNQQRTNDEK